MCCAIIYCCTKHIKGPSGFSYDLKPRCDPKPPSLDSVLPKYRPESIGERRERERDEERYRRLRIIADTEEMYKRMNEK